MGGSKQNYIITFSNAQTPEMIYLTFGNGKYARDIYGALNAYYMSLGYLSYIDKQENYTMLYKCDENGNVIDDETIVFRFYQKQLLWRGQLPDDIAFLDDYIPLEEEEE